MLEKLDVLRNIYYDAKHPAGFGTLDELAAASKLRKKDVQAWLLKQPTYTLHKHRWKHFKPLNYYYVGGANIQFQADLVDYSKYVTWNRGYKYILMVEDIFSRKAWAFPLKTKSGPEVASKFKDLFSSISTPKRLQVDQGTEFYNTHVKQVLDKYGIELFSIYSQTKCAHVERLNLTIKRKLGKIFTAYNSRNWIDVLDDVMTSYNNRRHRSIGMAPNQVSRANEADALKHNMKVIMQNNRHFKGDKKDRIEPFPVGTRVRISKNKGTFGRGYEANWSTEEFFVSRILNNNSRYEGTKMYKIKDASGEEIKGAFYKQELQKVIRDDEIYQIDQILQTRTRSKRKEYLVHWQGYPHSMNSWVPASEMKELGPTRQY